MILALTGLALLAGMLGIVLSLDGTKREPWMPSSKWKVSPGAIPVGILGDSDSASYQGSTGITTSDGPWGSAFRASKLQWPEVLMRIRSQEVDLGEWAKWGVIRWFAMAGLRDAVGQRWRAPRKLDYRHNLAIWGAGCQNLLHGPGRQVPRLLDIMDETPDAWARGVIVIRMGVNDFGGKEALRQLSEDPQAVHQVAIIQRCIENIRQTVQLIRNRHTHTKIVLVGIFNNAHWPPFHGEFQSPKELLNIDMGLDLFDNGLRAIAQTDPSIAFFDDRAWFTRHWGARDASGRPAYRSIRVAGIDVSNSSGDTPDHAVLADGHAGLVWNTLWIQDIVDLLYRQFGLQITGITDAEVESFVANRVR